MALRRSQRQLNQQMCALLTEGTTNVEKGLEMVVRVSAQLNTLIRLINTLLSMDSGSDFSRPRATLNSIERTHALFFELYPGILQIRQCEELYNIVAVRLRQCRAVMSVAESLPRERMPECCFARLPEHEPQNDESCAICFESAPQKWVRLPCGHAFHAGCAKTWLRDYKAVCPMCRASIS